MNLLRTSFHPFCRPRPEHLCYTFSDEERREEGQQCLLTEETCFAKPLRKSACDSPVRWINHDPSLLEPRTEAPYPGSQMGRGVSQHSDTSSCPSPSPCYSRESSEEISPSKGWVSLITSEPLINLTSPKLRTIRHHILPSADTLVQNTSMKRSHHH